MPSYRTPDALVPPPEVARHGMGKSQFPGRVPIQFGLTHTKPDTLIRVR